MGPATISSVGASGTDSLSLPRTSTDQHEVDADSSGRGFARIVREMPTRPVATRFSAEGRTISKTQSVDPTVSL